ncbi:MAG: T9SS type A sorting domain-containing protein, partial [Bacteroidota bacterium]
DYNTAEVLWRFRFVSDEIPEERDGWMIDNFNAGFTVAHTIETATQSAYIKAYPNPTTGPLEMKLARGLDYHTVQSVQVINSSGKIVQNYGRVPTKFRMDLSGLSAGTYFLSVQTNKRTEIIPVVVQNE